MKTLKYIAIPLFLVLVFFSCDEKTAADLFADYNARQASLVRVTPIAPNYDGNALADGVVSFQITDQFEGNDPVKEVRLYATYYNALSNTLYDEAFVATITTLPSVFTLSSINAAAIFGLEVADLGGGDIFTFRVITVAQDDVVFEPGVNLSAAICDEPGSRSTCKFQSLIVCDVHAAFVGTYTMTSSSSSFSAPNNTVTIIQPNANDPFTRQTTITFLGFTGRTLKFQLLCDNSVVPAQTTGLACANLPPLLFTTDTNNIGTYDPDDDSSFTVNVKVPAVAGCAGEFITSLTFTKQ